MFIAWASFRNVVSVERSHASPQQRSGIASRHTGVALNTVFAQMNE